MKFMMNKIIMMIIIMTVSMTMMTLVVYFTLKAKSLANYLKAACHKIDSSPYFV